MDSKAMAVSMTEQQLHELAALLSGMPVHEVESFICAFSIIGKDGVTAGVHAHVHGQAIPLGVQHAALINCAQDAVEKRADEMKKKNPEQAIAFLYGVSKCLGQKPCHESHIESDIEMKPPQS